MDAILRTGCGAERWIRVSEEFPHEITVPFDLPQAHGGFKEPGELTLQPSMGQTVVRIFTYHSEQMWHIDGKEMIVIIYKETA